MNNYFLTYVLVKSYYMEDGYQKENKSAMVEAESEAKAEETLKKYWDNRSDNYGVMYDAQDIEVAISLKQSEILSDEKKS